MKSKTEELVVETKVLKNKKNCNKRDPKYVTQEKMLKEIEEGVQKNQYIEGEMNKLKL